MVGGAIVLIIIGIIGYNLFVNAIHADPDTFTPQAVESVSTVVISVFFVIILSAMISLLVASIIQSRRERKNRDEQLHHRITNGD
jgi:hypothetical protein